MINQLSQHGILMLIPDRSPQSLLNLKSMCEELVNFSFCWIKMFCELWVQVKIFIQTPTPELQMKKTKFDQQQECSLPRLLATLVLLTRR